MRGYRQEAGEKMYSLQRGSVRIEFVLANLQLNGYKVNRFLQCLSLQSLLDGGRGSVG